MNNLAISKVTFISGESISIYPLVDFLNNAIKEGANQILFSPTMMCDDDGDFDIVREIDFIASKSIPLSEVELEEIRLAKEKEEESILQAKIFSLESKINQQEIGIRSFWTTKAKCEEELAQLRASKK